MRKLQCRWSHTHTAACNACLWVSVYMHLRAHLRVCMSAPETAAVHNWNSRRRNMCTDKSCSVFPKCWRYMQGMQYFTAPDAAVMAERSRLFLRILALWAEHHEQGTQTVSDDFPELLPPELVRWQHHTIVLQSAFDISRSASQVACDFVYHHPVRMCAV